MVANVNTETTHKYVLKYFVADGCIYYETNIMLQALNNNNNKY